MNKLAKALKDYREKNNITKSELSRILHVSPAYITNLEKGKRKNPTPNLLINIASTLDIPIRDLIEENEIDEKLKILIDRIEELKDQAEYKKKQAIKNMYNSMLDVMNYVNYLDCDADLEELLNNTDLFEDIVSLVRDIIASRINRYNEKYNKSKREQAQ